MCSAVFEVSFAPHISIDRCVRPTLAQRPQAPWPAVDGRGAGIRSIEERRARQAFSFSSVCTMLAFCPRPGVHCAPDLSTQSQYSTYPTAITSQVQRATTDLLTHSHQPRPFLSSFWPRAFYRRPRGLCFFSGSKIDPRIKVSLAPTNRLA